MFAALQIYLKSLNRLLLKFESFAAEGLAPLFASFTRPAGRYRYILESARHSEPHIQNCRDWVSFPFERETEIEISIESREL